jgi:hypothetical protein
VLLSEAAHAAGSTPAEDLIDDKTSWGNLDEEALGRHLLYRALSGQHAFVQEVFDELGTLNRDDVALELTSAATIQQLATLAADETGRRLLDRLYDELTGGNLAAHEKEQAERILAVKGQAIDPAQAEKQMLTGKVFPFRQGGITVLDDAPIMAERRAQGRRAEQHWRPESRVLGDRRHLGLIEVRLEFGQHEHNAVGDAERRDGRHVIDRLAGRGAGVFDLPAAGQIGFGLRQGAGVGGSSPRRAWARASTVRQAAAVTHRVGPGRLPRAA